MADIADLPMLHDIDADYSPQYVKLARILRDKIKSGQDQAAVVGANIRILRQQHGWNQAKVGELMGWPKLVTPPCAGRSAFSNATPTRRSGDVPHRRRVRSPGRLRNRPWRTSRRRSLLVPDVIIGLHSVETAGSPAAAAESGGPSRTGTSRSGRAFRRVRCRRRRSGCRA